jgi:predicted N-acyltransferase
MSAVFGMKIETSFLSFDENEWNALRRGDFIFADHRFLTSLEESGCIGPRTGWLPKVLALRENGKLAAALILFEKNQSYGEYIFDWSWAQAYQHHGIPYYPKLTSAIPFTPATGPKFLIHPDYDQQLMTQRLLREASALLELPPGRLSSLHFLFISEFEREACEREDFFIRHSFQYHWRNSEYGSFEDFLASLKRKRRNEIKRERAGAALLPFSLLRLSGQELTATHARQMHGFYLSTVEKMGAIPYLNARFFELVFERLRENILLCLAVDDSGEPVAGALNFFSGQTLFGRHWGSHGEFKYLHFELCYYQAIEWAIGRKTALFEAGAQGEHKLSRGFEPSLTYSAHRLQHRSFSDAIERFIEDEKRQIQGLFSELEARSPFQKNPGCGDSL